MLFTSVPSKKEGKKSHARIDFLLFLWYTEIQIIVGKDRLKQMRKNLKTCIGILQEDEKLCLIDMNHYDRIEQSGMTPDLVHKRSAHISAAWRFAEKTHVRMSLGGADLSRYRYLTFSVFAVNGMGGSFNLFFGSNEGENRDGGYVCTLPISHDGWNEYRIELPFLRAVAAPIGWDYISSIDLDCVVGGQSNRTDTVLYFDSLFVWKQMAPPLYATMPELKGAAAFAKNGGFAIVNRKRVALSIDGADVRPFEEKGVWWLPMGAIAAVMAHSAVADNKACTLTFTYRRKKYAFEAGSSAMQVGNEVQMLSFSPIAREGILFFPAEFVRDFFHWRQIFVDPMGLLILSNRKNIFESGRDFERIHMLIADMTLIRPDGEQILADLHKKIPNVGRGRVLATFDELMRLRKLAKTDEQLRAYVSDLKLGYGASSEAYRAEPITADAEREVILLACEKMIAFSMLYRVTGDKQYCERAALEAEAFASFADWQGDSMTIVSTVAFAMAIAYDWCHHVWSEARKAVVERAILRNALRPALAAYNGLGRMWDIGSANGAQINAHLLAATLAMADIYPETTHKLLDCILRNAEDAMKAFAPDGGFAEGVGAWERGATSVALMIAMLQTACGSDYGFSRMPGVASTAYFPIYAETQNGAWNYHNCEARTIDTSILPFFSALTGNPAFAQWRCRELQTGRKTVGVWDILFYAPTEAEERVLPLDAVYRRAGLAMMRADWQNTGMTVCLHGGKNNDRDSELDAGSFILECAGERFFVEMDGNQAVSALQRRRAQGQNTIVINPTDESIPDQNPGASAPFVAMRGAADRAFAIVDMTKTNDALLRAKRGVMLLEDRRVAVIQDEAMLAEAGVAVWSAYTPAKVTLNASGRAATLTLNGQTLLCKLCGVGYPARFEAETVGESGLSRLTVRVEVKERLRMAVVCRLLGEEDRATEKYYDITPMSKWEEI